MILNITVCGPWQKDGGQQCALHPCCYPEDRPTWHKDTLKGRARPQVCSGASLSEPLEMSRLQQQHPELGQSLTRFDIAQALGAVWALDLRTQVMLEGGRGEGDRFITINNLKNISLHSRYPSANCVTTHVVLPHPSFSFSSLLLSPPYLWLGNTPPKIRTGGFPSPSDVAAPEGMPAARPRQEGRSGLAVFVQQRKGRTRPQQRGTGSQERGEGGSRGKR